MAKSFLLFSILPLLFFTSCASKNSTDTNQTMNKDIEKQIIIIGPEMVTCDAGVMKKQCLQVKWKEDQEDWELFYNNIIGFEYETGYIYKLLVEVKQIKNPPADASSLAYRLIKELDKKELQSDNLTKEEVILILEDKNLILKPKGLSEKEIKETPSYQPKAEFLVQENIWKITSSTYEKVTYEDNCKNTNGCTPEIKRTVYVDAKTGEIIEENEERILHPNYE